MKRLLVDTSYVLGHFHTGDAHHAAALNLQDAFMNGAWEELVLLDTVFIETVTVLARRTNHGHARSVGRTLRTSEEIVFTHAGPLMDAAWEEFVSQPDDGLSIVDCTLVAASRQHRIPDIATFDRGFDAVPGIHRVPHDTASTPPTASP